MKVLIDKVKALIVWSQSRPLKTLIIIIAIETFVFLSLLVIFLWLVITRK